MAAAASAASAAAYAVLGGLGDAEVDEMDLGMAELAEDPGPLPHPSMCFGIILRQVSS
jgi:hypothetical protein